MFGVRDEAPQPGGVLDSRRGFDSARDVETVGRKRCGLGHIIRCEPARNEHAAQVQPSENVKRPRLSGTAKKP